jgi:hypothetical protein
MAMIRAEGSKSVEYLYGERMTCAKILSGSAENLLVDLNHLVPMSMFNIEIDKSHIPSSSQLAPRLAQPQHF